MKDQPSASIPSSPIQGKKASKSQLADSQTFEGWKKICDQILSKPFPPQNSDFPQESLKRDKSLDFSKFSIWQIVCEEILDTEHSHIYQQKCYEELLQRGKSKLEIFEMRKFAWYTAGWLNYAMMLWDWVHLDESDILLAIKWLFDYEQINQEQRIEFENFVRLHSDQK